MSMFSEGFEEKLDQLRTDLKRAEADRAELAAALKQMVLRISRRIRHTGDGPGGRNRCETGVDCVACEDDNELMRRSSAILARIKGGG